MISLKLVIHRQSKEFFRLLINSSLLIHKLDDSDIIISYRLHLTFFVLHYRYTGYFVEESKVKTYLTFLNFSYWIVNEIAYNVELNFQYSKEKED